MSTRVSLTLTQRHALQDGTVCDGSQWIKLPSYIPFLNADFCEVDSFRVPEWLDYRLHEPSSHFQKVKGCSGIKHDYSHKIYMNPDHLSLFMSMPLGSFCNIPQCL